MLNFRSALIALALSSSPFIVTAQLSAKATEDKKAHADEVSLDEIQKLVSTKGATIIDANSTDMYKEGHIPGAVSFAALQDKLATALPADKSALIVAYCGGPRCTAWEDAAAAAKKLGYTNVKHFKGGITGWKSAGQKVEKAS